MSKFVRLQDWVTAQQKAALTKLAKTREDKSRSALLREIIYKVLKVK